jgi:signal transduction histidine kinase
VATVGRAPQWAAPGLVHEKLFRGITARVLLASAVFAAVLAAAFALLIFAVGGQRDAGHLALRSQQGITAGSELQKSVISLDNGLRGYVASGRDRSLEPWNAALRQYPRQVRRLAALVSDEPGQRAEVARISGEIDDYVNLWGQPLLGLARDRLPAARSVLVNGTGRARIETIRRSFARLFTQERQVAASREHGAERRSDLAVAAGIGGLLLVLLLVGGAVLLLRRHVVQPVLTVAGASRSLADGDMSARVPTTGSDEIGQLARAFNTMADSLERSRGEVAARTRELERSNEELDRFASVTSHDLQAPLTTISMYAQLLEKRHGENLGDGQELVDGICAATGQARDLVRGVLDYARAGRGELRCEPVDTEQLVHEVLDLLAGPIQDAGATVTVGELPVLPADERNLRQVFQNLIGNAIKFVDGAPEVSVTAQRTEAGWRFAVRDNGIGMDPAQAERIFQPFERLNAADRYPGTGIGLAVCMRIVEQHGGRIWVETRRGRGSTFNFALPAPVGAELAQDTPGKTSVA